MFLIGVHKVQLLCLLKLLHLVSLNLPRILQVGTVLNIEDAERAVIAGAKFLMSPAIVKVSNYKILSLFIQFQLFPPCLIILFVQSLWILYFLLALQTTVVSGEATLLFGLVVYLGVNYCWVRRGNLNQTEPPRLFSSCYKLQLLTHCIRTGKKSVYRSL